MLVSAVTEVVRVMSARKAASAKIVGFIAGSGFEAVLPKGSRKKADTPFGKVEYLSCQMRDVRVIAIPRHGFSHSLAPHQVPSRAHMFALHEMGIDRVLASSAVGSVNPSMKPGDIVLANQFIDLTHGRCGTYYEDRLVHTDMTEPYCKAMNAALSGSAKEARVSLQGGATYACTQGPRYETPAEVQMIGRLGGDLIGQSAVPEAVFARELGLCYALVTVVSNWGAGLQPTVSSRDIIEVVWEQKAALAKLLGQAIPAVARFQRSKRCTENAAEARALAVHLTRTWRD